MHAMFEDVTTYHVEAFDYFGLVWSDTFVDDDLIFDTEDDAHAAIAAIQQRGGDYAQGLYRIVLNGHYVVWEGPDIDEEEEDE